mmetsp:Transcript_3213/g.10789  ORF Transcript_3213/g.10789 Transcript_3213/m.10789 type:complete len:313 (-) Transcript_3213:499-1437(-)
MRCCERVRGPSHRPARRSGVAHHVLHGPPGHAARPLVRRLLQGDAGAAAQLAAHARGLHAARGDGGRARASGRHAWKGGRLAGRRPDLPALRQCALPGRASGCRDARDGLMLGHPGRGADRHAALLRGRAPARAPLLQFPCMHAPLDPERDAPPAMRDVPVPPAHRAGDLARVRSLRAGAPRRIERTRPGRASECDGPRRGGLRQHGPVADAGVPGAAAQISTMYGEMPRHHRTRADRCAREPDGPREMPPRTRARTWASPPRLHHPHHGGDGRHPHGTAPRVRPPGVPGRAQTLCRALPGRGAARPSRAAL